MQLDDHRPHLRATRTVHDLTDDCAGFADREDNGLHLFVAHATAGLVPTHTGMSVRVATLRSTCPFPLRVSPQ